MTTDYRTIKTTDQTLMPTGGCCIAWPAIISGAVAAAAISLLLVILGSGLGLSFSSPYSPNGSSIVGFTVKTAIWLIVVQWIASAVGGFLTGRLRHKSVNVHGDEVFFRDTAHGFLAWALATLFTAGFLASAIGSVVNVGAHTAPAMMAAGPHAGAPDGGIANPMGYYVDNLFRTSSKPRPTNPDARAEASRILMMDAKETSFPQDDKSYLASLVAANTGMSADEAGKRVDDTLARMHADEDKAKAEADKARKSAAAFAFFTFFSMLIGAFIAAVSAALGGIHRDEY